MRDGGGDAGVHLARAGTARGSRSGGAEGNVIRDQPQPARRIAGLIAGAEPIDLHGTGDSAVLLLHGFGDTPQTLGYLAAALHDAGFTVRAPLLPGHGSTVDEFNRSRADEWIEHARAEYGSMVPGVRAVGLGGLSMGGALAAIVAAGTPRLPALVLLAPYLGMPRPLAAVALLHRVWGPLAGQLRARSDLSIHDPDERAKNLAYGVTTADAIRQLLEVTRLARNSLSSITAPTLILQSRNDNRVSRKIAEYAYRTIPAADKRLVFVERGGHVLTVDHDREIVAARARDWFTDHM